MRLLKPTASLRSRLNWILIATLVGFAIVTSVATSWVIGNQLERQARYYVTSVAEQLGRNSTFAFLVPNPGPARRALKNGQSFPGARYVAFLDANGELMDSVGPAPTWSPTVELLAQHTQTSILLDAEEDGLWHVLAPVRTSSASTVEPEVSTPSELLGFVHFTWTRSLLTSATVSLFGINLIVAVLLAVLVGIWIRVPLNRLTRPLSNLAATMAQARGKGDLVAADIVGPQELRNMAIAFNGLIDTINAQTRHLESEVRARTEALEAALAESKSAASVKSDFLALVSHDMRTPLYAITGYTQLASNELPGDNETLSPEALLESLARLKGYLQQVEEVSDELLQSINKLLDFSKLETGKIELNIKPTDLSALVTHVSNKVEFLCTQRDNVLNIDVRAEQRVLTDPEKLEHILSELLTNACKFTTGGDIRVEATADADAITIAVQDSGIGIPEDQLAFIFEPFRQARTASGGREPGTGLGLAIAKQFCALLDGTIQVTSAVGQGSRFEVCVPLAKSSLSGVSSVFGGE